jgi:hypothetical protein
VESVVRGVWVCAGIEQGGDAGRRGRFGGVVEWGCFRAGREVGIRAVGEEDG